MRHKNVGTYNFFLELCKVKIFKTMNVNYCPKCKQEKIMVEVHKLSLKEKIKQEMIVDPLPPFPLFRHLASIFKTQYQCSRCGWICMEETSENSNNKQI